MGVVPSEIQSAKFGTGTVHRMKREANVYISPESSTIRPTSNHLSGSVEKADTLVRALHSLTVINTVKQR